MKIYVDRIPTEGVVESETYEPSEMESGMDRDDVHLHKPFVLNVRISRFNHDVVVRGDLNVPMECTCARCLETFEFTGKSVVTLSYPVEGKDMVDITEDVRQEAILTYPMVPHCSDSCKGLCSSCGANLNLDQNHRCSVTA